MGWCIIQHPKTVSGKKGDEVTVYGRVYVEGITDQTVDGVDENPLVVAQIGGAPPEYPVEEWDDVWDYALPFAGYGNDDEYKATFTVDFVGEINYLFRFSADGGNTWTLCDQDGIAADPPNFGHAVFADNGVESPCDSNPCNEPTPVCVEDATSEGFSCHPQYNVGWCILQHPKEFTGTASSILEAYGQVYIQGITDQTHGTDEHPLVKAQFGIGYTSVEHDGWVDALPNTGFNNNNDNDEYMTNLSFADFGITGELVYLFRFSADGGNTWTLCDQDGIAADPPNFGHATITPTP
ncbi:MAG: hypothetical protein ACOX2F_09340 [bacterium]